MFKKDELRPLQLRIDAGGSSGSVACAFRLSEPNGHVIHQERRLLGSVPSNAAKYKAVVFGLDFVAGHHGQCSLTVLSNLQLLVHQMTGRASVKDEVLRTFVITAQTIARRIAEVIYEYEPDGGVLRRLLRSGDGGAASRTARVQSVSGKLSRTQEMFPQSDEFSL